MVRKACGKNPLDRLGHRWENRSVRIARNVSDCVDLMYVFLDKQFWRVVLITAMNIWDR